MNCGEKIQYYMYVISILNMGIYISSLKFEIRKKYVKWCFSFIFFKEKKFKRTKLLRYNSHSKF